MRMSVQVPRSMMGAIPDPHGVVTNHDGLAMYGAFRKVARTRWIAPRRPTNQELLHSWTQGRLSVPYKPTSGQLHAVWPKSCPSR